MQPRPALGTGLPGASSLGQVWQRRVYCLERGYVKMRPQPRTISRPVQFRLIHHVCPPIIVASILGQYYYLHEQLRSFQLNITSCKYPVQDAPDLH